MVKVKSWNAHFFPQAFIQEHQGRNIREMSLRNVLDV